MQILYAVVLTKFSFELGSGGDADYLAGCLRDIERIRIALTSIIFAILNFSVFIFMVYACFKKHRQSAFGKIVVFWIIIAIVFAGLKLSALAIDVALKQADADNPAAAKIIRQWSAVQKG